MGQDATVVRCKYSNTVLGENAKSAQKNGLKLGRTEWKVPSPSRVKAGTDYDSAGEIDKYSTARPAVMVAVGPLVCH